MNEYTATNLNEQMMTLIALMGQAHQSHFELLPMSGYYKQNIIRNLVNLKLIEKAKYKKGTFYRLKKPAGLNYLFKMSRTLYDHYIVISNEHEYRNDINYIERQIAQGKIITMLFINDISIDTIKTSYDNMLKRKSPKSTKRGGGQSTTLALSKSKTMGYGVQSIPPDATPIMKRGEPIQPPLKTFKATELSEHYAPTDTYYFTSKIIKNAIGESGKGSLNISRFTGVLMSKGGTYVMYQLNEDQTWIPKGEQTVRRKIPEVMDKILNIEKPIKQKGRGKCIVITDNYKIKDYIINKSKPKKGRENVIPYNVYDNAYIIPYNKDGIKILKLLTEENWDIKVKSLLYPEKGIQLAQDEKYKRYSPDAYSPKFGYSYELLTCDIRKLHIILESIEKEKIHIVCFKWQEEELKELLKNKNITFTIITEEDFQKITGGN